MPSGLPRLSECRECQTPIRFVRLESGKAMPVDPMPSPSGNIAARRNAHQLEGFVISRDRQPGGTYSLRFRAHYATCEAVDRTPTSTGDTDPPPTLF